MLTHKKPAPAAAATLTDKQIHLVRKAFHDVPRKSAYHRTILVACGPAMDGDMACRESVAGAYNKLLEEPT